MLKRVSGFALIIALLFAPIAAAIGGWCPCPHEEAGPLEIAPIPCCAVMHQCCMDHGESHETFPVVTDLSQQFRVEVDDSAQRLLGVLPLAFSFAQPKYFLSYGADPPGAKAVSGQLSIRQIWLI